MQLKRDTEYALRILLCLGDDLNQLPGNPGKTLLEICKETSIPKRQVLRICNALENRRMIVLKKTETEEKYHPCEGMLEHSLKDVLDITENGVEIFAVFNNADRLSRFCASSITQIQGRIEAIFTETTLKAFFNYGIYG